MWSGGTEDVLCFGDDAVVSAKGDWFSIALGLRGMSGIKIIGHVNSLSSPSSPSCPYSSSAFRGSDSDCLDDLARCTLFVRPLLIFLVMSLRVDRGLP